MTPAEVAQRVEGRPIGEGRWSARCPAHEDSKASLNIGTGEGGRTLIHCHAGCEPPAVVAAAGLRMSDLAPERLQRPGKLGRVVAVYSYTDEAGAELFQAVRFEPKDFRQRHRAGPGEKADRERWCWKRGAVRAVVYRLPAVRSAIGRGETIWIVEGEKDAEALERLGLTATCNPGGAGKWRRDHTACLTGAARVVVIADKDAAGRQHARQVADAVSTIGARANVVEVPAGKDASDWIAAGATREGLEALAEAAPQVAESDAESPPEMPEPPPFTDEDGPAHQHVTESSLAEELVRQHGDDLRYCADWRKWLHYRGARWKTAPTAAPVQQLAIRLIRRLRVAAAMVDEKATKALFASEKRSARDSVVALAAHEERVQVTHTDLDAQPFLLNVKNGTIDLRTGKLRAHRREDLLTKLAPLAYDPAATAPRWTMFLEQIFAGKQQVIAFVQRAVGYCLTGDVREQVFFIAHGSGANGKSTMLGALLAALGGYGWAAGDDLLIAPKGERHPQELANLFGRRLVVCQETAEGNRFNESRVKRLTGGDPVTARRMREDDWTFEPTHKLWLSTNHRPTVRAGGEAFWRRVNLIPFEQVFPAGKREEDLPDQLRLELPGILRWAVDGCLEWQRGKGLKPPHEVAAATAEYRQAEDQIAAFIAECCVVAPDKVAKWSEIYGAYRLWAEDRREWVEPAKSFGVRLEDRKFPPGTMGHDKVAIRRGIGLLEGVRVHAGPADSSPHVARAYEANEFQNPHGPADDYDEGGR